MREELAAAVGGLIANANTDEMKLNDTEVEQLVKAADIVTMARTAVEREEVMSSLRMRRKCQPGLPSS